MSLEDTIKENTATMKALGADLRAVAENQVKLLAGQQAAIEAANNKAGGKVPASPKVADKTPAASTAKPAETAKAAEKPDNVVTDEKLKAIAVAATNAATKGTEKGSAEETAARAKVSGFFKTILDHFGVEGKMCGAESKLDDEQRKQAAFFIKRNAHNLPVNFSADYDFDGDVKQAGKEPAAAEAEDDLLG